KAKGIPPQPMTTTPATTTPTSSNTTVNLGRLIPDDIIDPYVKSYIDESIRASTASVTNSIKQYINSQFDRQRS
ncbi:33124_t:CDS:1, partial [Gigaspora margarita]